MTIIDSSDARLIAALHHDASALDAFYRRQAPSLLAFALRRCRDPQEAADLVSLVFLRAIDGARTFDARRGSARSWLFGIALRELADLRNDERRRAEIAARLGGPVQFDEDEFALAERRIDAHRRSRALMAAVAQLTPLEAEMLRLVTEDDLSPSEAARVLRVSPLVARVRLARARARLRAAEAARPGPITKGAPDGC